MRYAEIAESPEEQKRAQLRLARSAHLYGSIFRDIVAILKVLLPSDKALTVSQHLKSIMYSLIEMKTGKRPDKF
jgi:hypothetical protein